MKKLFTKLLAVMSAGIMSATANLSVSAEAWDESVNYADPLWMVEYLTGEEVIYSNGKTYVTEDGDMEHYSGGGVSMNYILHLESEELTLEKLGLSAEEYTLKKGTTSLVDGTVHYYINVSTLEEADALYEKAMAIVDTGVFINAYKQCRYFYGCNVGGGNLIIKLKDADAGIDLSFIENYEDLSVSYAPKDPTMCYIKFSDGFEYKSVMEAKETIEANENVESTDVGYIMCAVAHTHAKTEYIFEETIVPNYVFMTLAGDIDLDDETGISDIVAITKYTASPELYAITNRNALGNADVNKDNSIDSLDTSILIENLLGGYKSAV